MDSNVRPFWPPLIAGFALGIVLFATFLFTGNGLGASGFFTRLTAWLGKAIAPSATGANAYLGPFLRGSANPLAAWISWEIVGLAVGASVSALANNRFRLRLDGAPKAGAGGRMILAIAGGVLTGFGAQLARGCTSGMGLSGGATLAVAGFLFLIGFFVAGIIISRLVRSLWI